MGGRLTAQSNQGLRMAAGCDVGAKQSTVRRREAYSILCLLVAVDFVMFRS